MKTKEKYKRWTLAQQASLAQTVAASTFHTFCNPKFRGPKWTPESMIHIIVSQIKVQCLMGNINPKHHERVEQIAVDFYKRYLAKAMEEIG